jgi:outer membrane protein TolC
LTRAVQRKAQIRFEAGDVPQFEVVRAQVEAARATNQVTLAKNGLAAAQAQFNTLLARPLNTAFSLIDSLAYQPFTADLDQLKAMAVAQRPDLLGAQLRSTALRTQQAAATAAYVPDLNVGLFRQRLRNGTSELDFWRLNFALEVPLWALSRQRAERAEVRAKADQVEAQQEAVRHQVLLDTARAYLDVSTAQEQVALFQGRILPEAERAFEVASRSYDEGKAAYLELLEAQRTLTETQIEYLQSLFGYHVAKAQLEWAVAGPLPQ